MSEVSPGLLNLVYYYSDKIVTYHNNETMLRDFIFQLVNDIVKITVYEYVNTLYSNYEEVLYATNYTRDSTKYKRFERLRQKQRDEIYKNIKEEKLYEWYHYIKDSLPPISKNLMPQLELDPVLKDLVEEVYEKCKKEVATLV